MVKLLKSLKYNGLNGCQLQCQVKDDLWIARASVEFLPHSVESPLLVLFMQIYTKVKQKHPIDFIKYHNIRVRRLNSFGINPFKG